MMPTTMDLRAERESRKMSRSELAELAGVTVSTIATMERGGEPRGGDGESQRVWDALGVPPSEGVPISPGDVVVAQVAHHEVLLKVKTVTEREITGTEMLHYTGDSFKRAMSLGASSVKHRGVTYLLRHVKTVRRDAVTRHWVCV